VLLYCSYKTKQTDWDTTKGKFEREEAMRKLAQRMEMQRVKVWTTHACVCVCICVCVRVCLRVRVLALQA